MRDKVGRGERGRAGTGEEGRHEDRQGGHSTPPIAVAHYAEVRGGGMRDKGGGTGGERAKDVARKVGVGEEVGGRGLGRGGREGGGGRHGVAGVGGGGLEEEGESWGAVVMCLFSCFCSCGGSVSCLLQWNHKCTMC